jgi:hypothetical protein
MPDPTPISGLPSDSTLALSDVVIVNHDNGDGTFTTERATLTEVQTAIGGGGGGGGVPSVNGITGAVTIVSPDSSVDVVVDGDEIQLTTSGGGGGGGGGSSTPATYDEMVRAWEPTYYWPLSEAGASAIDTQQATAAHTSGTTPTRQTASLLTNGDQSTTFPNGSRFNFYFNNSTGFTPQVGFECWFNLPVLPTSPQRCSIFQTGPITSGNVCLAIIIDSGGNLTVQALDEGTLVGAPSPIVAGDTYHLAFNCDNYRAYLYLNGVLVATATGEAIVGNGIQQAFIGGDASGDNVDGQGVIIQKLAFTPGRMIPADVIAAHYAGGTTSTYAWPFAVGAPALPSYDSVIIGQSATHYWPLNDAEGSSTAADAIGGQPLTVGDAIYMGAAPLTPDGETSAWCSGPGATALTMPAACQPTDTFSISFIAAVTASEGSTIWAFGNDSTNFGVGIQSSSGYCLTWSILNQLNAWYQSYTPNTSSRCHICVTWNGSVFYLYVNGAPAINADGFFTPVPSTTDGQLLGLPGRMAKAAIWVGTVLTVQQVLAQVAAAGL